MSATLQHIGIILDGNRRWAKQNGMPSIEGHRRAAYVIEKIITYLRLQGVHTITIWVFSTENWGREQAQVKGLLSLFQEFLEKHSKKAFTEGVRVIHLGRKDRLSESFRKKIGALESASKDFKNGILNVALDYGGRDEIIRAIKEMIESDVNVSNISEELFNEYLDTRDQPHPYPDMIIRTGGEMRLSGFMSWQSAYSELVVLDKYLPDLTIEDIKDVLKEYAHRKRRFGK